MLRFACPACKSVMEVGDERRGATVACPRCRKPLQVPRTPPRPIAAPISAGRPMAPVAAVVSAQPVTAAPSPSAARGRGAILLLVSGGVLFLLLAVGVAIAMMQMQSHKKKNGQTSTWVEVPDDEIPDSTSTQSQEKDSVIAGLSSKSADVRFKAIKDLDQRKTVSKAAMPGLTKILQDRTDSVAAIEMRRLAARSIGKMGADAPPALPLLGIAIGDPSPLVRLAAVDAMDKIGKPAIPTLTDAVHSDDTSVRLQAAAILGKHGKDARDAVPAILLVIKESNKDQQIRLCAALVKIDNTQKDVVPYLVEGVKDTNDNNRRISWIALGEMGPNANGELNDLFDAYTNEFNGEVKDIADGAYRKISGQ